MRGSTDIDDVFLNLAGTLAPVVALVPTPQGRISNCTACSSTPGAFGDRGLNVPNNMTALFIAGGVALLLLVVSRLD